VSKNEKLSKLATPPAPEDEQLAEVRRALLKTQRKLAQTKAKIGDLVEATQNAAREACLAQGRFEVTPAPKASKLKTIQEVALWDTQCSSQPCYDRLRRSHALRPARRSAGHQHQVGFCEPGAVEGVSVKGKAEKGRYPSRPEKSCF
jgi:hypothetical protein